LKPATFLSGPRRAYRATVVRRELLPFRVRLVSTAQDLEKVVEIRSTAYSRHYPQLAEPLSKPEPEDNRSDVLLLIAERKIDQKPLGSMRLQPNFLRPLRIEGEAKLPPIYTGRRLVETTRLGIENGLAGTMVMVALAKAAFEICHATDIEFGIAGGRRPMAHVLRSLGYDEIAGPIPISYGNNLPHWVFGIPIADVEARLHVNSPPYYEFMARTEHPDIHIDYGHAFEVFRRPTN
jgi:hypothetical protein